MHLVNWMQRVLILVILITSLAVAEAFAGAPTMSVSPSSVVATKHRLFDMPVSNNGARCRLIVYKKRLPESEVAILSPMDIGGMKSKEYLALNPQGKIPLMIADEIGMPIPESDTICRYLISKYSENGPSFQPENTKSNLIARLHDMYLTTIQGCLYKATPPFGMHGTRKDAIAEFRRQLQVIDDLLDGKGQYLCGDEVSLGDATLFPTMIFAKYMLPKFGIPVEEALPGKIDKWYEGIIQSDEDFQKVYGEVMGGLLKWDENTRWDNIWLAGVRDEEPGTIFDSIIAGDIPAAIVKETAKVLAFKDINPVAPAHILVIPKDRSGLSGIRKATPDHAEILGLLLVAAGEIANDESLGFGDGARIVINDGTDGGQEVPHLHVHVLGGRKLTWPPG